jgi:hypothetical protein
MCPIHEFRYIEQFLKILYIGRFGVLMIVARSQIAKIKNPSFWFFSNKVLVYK